jgi:AraC-like DNA-binding protein
MARLQIYARIRTTLGHCCAVRHSKPMAPQLPGTLLPMWEREETSTIWSCQGIQVNRERYHAERYRRCGPRQGTLNAITLMRYGAYRRRADGIDHVVDITNGCFLRRDEEVTLANFTGEPEELTYIVLSDEFLAQLLAEPQLPSGPFTVTPEVDLDHRMLLRAINDRADNAEIEAQVVDLTATVVALRRADLILGGRATTQHSHRSLVSDAREILHLTGGDISQQELARRVGSSPFHLSRVFKSVTGTTISQYRLRLRIHRVLDHLAQGEENLAILARAVGFSDHSHMTRTVIAQLGEAPSALRRRLTG